MARNFCLLTYRCAGGLVAARVEVPGRTGRPSSPESPSREGISRVGISRIQISREGISREGINVLSLSPR